MEITANNTKELLVDYGSEVVALVQRGETDKLSQLTNEAHEELAHLIKEQNSDLYEALEDIINSETMMGRDNFNNALKALAKAKGKDG